jgi:hypothetical protein
MLLLFNNNKTPIQKINSKEEVNTMTLIPLARTSKMTQEQLDRFAEALKTILGRDENIKLVQAEKAYLN